LPGRRVVVGIRPERLEDAALATELPADRRVRGVVRLREALGSDVLLHFALDGARTRLSPAVHALAHDVEDPAEVEELEGGHSAVFVGRVSPQSQVREDEAVEVALRPGALQFFEPATGQAIV